MALSEAYKILLYKDKGVNYDNYITRRLLGNTGA